MVGREKEREKGGTRKARGGGGAEVTFGALITNRREFQPGKLWGGWGVKVQRKKRPPTAERCVRFSARATFKPQTPNNPTPSVPMAKGERKKHQKTHGGGEEGSFWHKDNSRSLKLPSQRSKVLPENRTRSKKSKKKHKRGNKIK